VYRPMHRSVGYLVDLLQAGFKPGSFGIQRAVKPVASGEKVPSDAPVGSAAAAINVDSDVVFFHGTPKDILRFKSILPMVDTPVGEVVVKAIVYEVTTGRNESSAFSLALSLLGGRFGVSVSSGETLANALTIKTGSIDAVLSAFKGDSRFKAVSTPTLRVKSGQRAQLMVGQDVPTLSSVAYPQGGNVPVQSVEYRSSGVILNLSPTVREGGIDVLVDQQISDFARTESGVNNSPTLTKRSLSTTVGMVDGDLIVLGGLTQDRNTTADSGQSWMPKFMRSSSVTDSRTEVLLLLQVTRIGG
jgi:general secretion pathway protein D